MWGFFVLLYPEEKPGTDDGLSHLKNYILNIQIYENSTFIFVSKPTSVLTKF